MPSGVQGLDRYAYVNNSPVNYTDPTGHVCSDPEDPNGSCEGGGGTLSKNYATNFYRAFLKDRYGWDVADDFTEDELRTIRQTAYDIEAYVDGLTGGGGLEWTLAYLGNTDFKKWDEANSETWLGGIPFYTENNTIFLTASDITERWISHELGHIWDINTADYTLINGAVGGVGDALSSYFNGNPSGQRYKNISPVNPNVPQNYLFIGYTYGNTSTADYLAETFSSMIYHPEYFPPGVNQRNWVETMISIQVSQIP